MRVIAEDADIPAEFTVVFSTGHAHRCQLRWGKRHEFGVSLLIISDAGDDGGYGSPWLKDPTIRKIIINLSIPFLGA
jgi:hypothetical protein